LFNNLIMVVVGDKSNSAELLKLYSLVVNNTQKNLPYN